MTILEMQEQIVNLRAELKGIIDNGEAEKRELADNETSRLAEIRSEIDRLESAIAEEEQRNQESKENNKTNKTMEKQVRLYDIIKGLALDKELTPEEKRFVSGRQINWRADIQAGVATAGQENVPEDKKSLDVAIRNASILSRIGATWFGNAVGDISMPKYGGSTVGWKGEIEKADNGEGTFSEVLLQPKRLTAVLNVSKTFLAQDSNDAEAILMKDLADAVAEKLDQTVFSASSGSTTQPAGLFNGDYVTTGNTLSSVTYDDVLDAELGVEEKNGHNFIFIADPKVKYALKGVQMASGLDMVYTRGEIDGYPAFVSNSVVDGGLMCVDPRDIAGASWGLELTVDPFSRADYNEIRLIVNYLVDVKLRGDRIAGAIFE